MGSPVCEAGVEAQLAILDDSASGGKALARLDSLMRSASNFRDQMVTIGNLIAARLYERRGDTLRALDLYRRRAGWNFYLSTQLREEGRLAAALGDRAAAISAYQHYLALRTHAEPRLRPDVAGVRRELARLGQ